jgi:hypothetical protein
MKVNFIKLIIYLLVIPRDALYWNTFFNLFSTSKLNEVAIAGCGYSGNDFTITKVHFNQLSGELLHKLINDLD